ncbi:MAG: hypothetical protein IPM52_13300 [Bacteroidetes bacterium]|nr:hypothetical protein [Bacteroidota bacterium]
MRQQLFLALVQRLQLLCRHPNGSFYMHSQAGHEHQVFRHFDLWSPMLEWLDEEPPFALPALFIEFAPIQWRQQSQGIRDATITLRLHIVARRRQPSRNPAQGQSMPTDYLALPDGLQLCLHGFKTGSFATFTNTLSETDHQLDELAHLVETYTTLATDSIAHWPNITQSAQLVIE